MLPPHIFNTLPKARRMWGLGEFNLPRILPRVTVTRLNSLTGSREQNGRGKSLYQLVKMLICCSPKGTSMFFRLILMKVGVLTFVHCHLNTWGSLSQHKLKELMLQRKA